MAWNLESMVVFRLAQGIFGAPLVPLSQAILLDAFPRERHGQALAIFGLGIMVAPVIGPVLGGYLTEIYSWRMVFYINVPIGLFAAALGYPPRRASRTSGPIVARCWCSRSAPCTVLDQGQATGSTPSSLPGQSSPCSQPRRSPQGLNKPTTSSMSLLRPQFRHRTLAITAYGISLFGWMALMPLLSQRLLDIRRQWRVPVHSQAP